MVGIMVLVGLVVDIGVVAMPRRSMRNVRVRCVDVHMVTIMGWMVWHMVRFRMMGRMVRIHQGGGVRLRMVMGRMVRIQMVRVHMVRVHMVRVHMVRVHMVIHMVWNMVGVRQVLRMMIGIGQMMRRMWIMDQSGVHIPEMGHVVWEQCPSGPAQVWVHPRVDEVQVGPLAHLVA